MSSGDDAAICTLAQLLDELVLCIDDECRVERGKTMSLHDGKMYLLIEISVIDLVELQLKGAGSI